MRVFYTGNGTYGQGIGGHAYLNFLAMNSWKTEPNPVYWTMHEFTGHSFTGMKDEYWSAVDNGPNVHQYPDGVTTGKVRDMPWRRFIGKEGYTFPKDSPRFVTEHTGMFHYDTSKHKFRSTEDSAMNGNPVRAWSGWQRFIIYRTIYNFAFNENIVSGDEHSKLLNTFFEYDKTVDHDVAPALQ